VLNSNKNFAEQEAGQILPSGVQNFALWQESIIQAIRDRNIEAEWSTILNPPPERTKYLNKKLIHSLSYDGLKRRYEQIESAHQKTFGWVYKVLHPANQSWDSFVAWLISGTGPYWITGKPGSRKSTLMKFLFQNYRTLEHLKTWANDSPLVLAGFWFWNSGSGMQKSEEGLLRSLLHSIATSAPWLIPRLFPERWRIWNLFGFDPTPWQYDECLNALRRLATSEFADIRFALFVDGLDECHENHEALLRNFRELSKSPHVKLCMASRPWVVFQHALGQCSNLTLQDLTRPDIEIFVKSRFENDPGFKRLKIRDRSSFTKDIYNEISSRSSGVFLWVRLVVHSLLTGMRDGDRISDLQTRLKKLPSELDDLFWKILESTDPLYTVHAYELLQIRKAHQLLGSPSLFIFAFADEENLKVLKLAKTAPLNSSEILSYMDTIKIGLIVELKVFWKWLSKSIVK
jgi:hypothetical protein